MMPFSVLRTWALSIWGWGLLALGIYLIYEWSDGLSVTQTRVSKSTTTQADVREEPSRLGERPTREVIVKNSDDRLGGTSCLSLGLALVLFSTFSGTPWIFLFGKRTSDDPGPFQSERNEQIARPDGSLLYVEHLGPKNAPTLLFTHGWSLNHTEWDYIRRNLADRYHLVFWDLPGLGKSKAPANRDHSIRKMAEDLEAVLAKSTYGPTILVGHSIGGMIQQTFCRLFPQHLSGRVRGMVLTQTTYKNPLKTAMASGLLVALQWPLIVPLNYLTMWLSPWMWLSNWQSYLNGSSHVTSRLSSFAGTQTWGQIDRSTFLMTCASPAILARGNLEMLKFDEEASLPQCKVPTLVIAGHNDRLTTPAASEQLVRLIPKATLATLKPAGHLGLWEQHAGFQNALLEFAERIFAAPNDSKPKAVSPNSDPLANAISS